MRSDVVEVVWVVFQIPTEIGQAPDTVLQHSDLVEIVLREGDDFGEAVFVQDDLAVFITVSRYVSQCPYRLLLNFDVAGVKKG